MKVINITYFCLVLGCTLILSSCLGDKDPEVEFSDNPNFVSLAFSKNDSIPNIHKAAFKVVKEESLEDSVIVNLDSLPVNTRIDSVFATFKFKSSLKEKAQLVFKDINNLDSIVTLTGKDTLNFSQAPIYVQNVAADGIKTIRYLLKVNVHKVEPELFVWSKVSENLYADEPSNQKAIYLNDNIFYYATKGENTYLFTSADGYSWSDASSSLSGLPATALLRNMTAFKDKLYLFAENDILTSVDGKTWTSTNSTDGTEFVNLLYIFQDKLWGIEKKMNQEYYFTNTADGVNWMSLETIPEDFPVQDFAAISFKSPVGIEKVVVVGGYTASGILLAGNVWSTEGDKWISFASSSKLEALYGASIIRYDDKLLMFGAMDKSGKIIDKPHRQSLNEGFSWYPVDTVYNQMPAEYEHRGLSSVLVNEHGRIFIIGGKDGVSNFSDVWTGKLNRIGFEIKD